MPRVGPAGKSLPHYVLVTPQSNSHLLHTLPHSHVNSCEQRLLGVEFTTGGTGAHLRPQQVTAQPAGQVGNQ